MSEPMRMPEPHEREEPTPQREAPVSGMAVASLVLGLIGAGLFFVPGLGIVSSILAIIFGFVGISQTSRKVRRGQGMAIAGVILGGIGLLIFIYTIALIPRL
jgi:uncharacterized membrane protein